MPMTKEEFTELIGFRYLDASDILPMKIDAATGGMGTMLTMLDVEANEWINPTKLIHTKFMVRDKVKWSTEEGTYTLVMSALLTMFDVPAEMCQGHGHRRKEGMYTFNTEYQTCVRIWSSKKVGKNLIFEVTVAGYKDAIPYPLK